VGENAHGMCTPLDIINRIFLTKMFHCTVFYIFALFFPLYVTWTFFPTIFYAFNGLIAFPDFRFLCMARWMRVCLLHYLISDSSDKKINRKGRSHGNDKLREKPG
jgi:hypothetical protein